MVSFNTVGFHSTMSHFQIRYKIKSHQLRHHRLVWLEGCGLLDSRVGGGGGVQPHREGSS